MKSVLVLSIFILVGILLSLFNSMSVYAQENDSLQKDVQNETIIKSDGTNESADNFGEEFSDSELESDAGITPDSNFYFVDEFFDKFSDEIKVREEKIAEIRAMIKAGNIEAAKISLESYKEYADALEKESDPDKKDEAQRSAAAIRNTIRELENDIPEDERGDFVDDVINREERISIAVEIASKVKELCEQLSKIDPLEFSRVCKSDKDSPEWQKKFHRDLTEEQKKEVQAFGKIMSECFRTQGEQCRCEDISIKPFANRCSIVAPLALKCDEGDESACESMDDATEGMEDLLPDYLQDVMADIERRYGGDQFESHMPEECREVGAKTAKECMKVMFRLNAPEECIKALDEGRIDLSNEREARKACEEIMFKENAPEECIEVGLKDPKECGKLMFRQNAPQECLDAGLTGDNRGDEKKCREIMESQRKEGGPRGGPGGFNPDCRRIENADERLKCYDSALEGSRSEERNHGGWPQQCEEAKALTRESCEVVMREFGEKQRQNFNQDRERGEGEFREGGEFNKGEGQFRGPECGENQHSECDQSGCRCVDNQQPSQGFIPPEGFNPEQQPPTETTQSPTTESTTIQTSGEQTTTTTPTESTSSGSTTTSTSGGGESGSSGSTETSGTTGGIISTNNEFFNYYYR